MTLRPLPLKPRFITWTLSATAMLGFGLAWLLVLPSGWLLLGLGMRI